MTGVIYARYSSDNQREESIEGQLRECKVFAEKNGIQIIDTYIDRAMSAKTDNRPDFQKMIKDSAKQQFETVKVDVSKPENRRRLVDSFVNSIILYDDRIEFYFNFKKGAKTLSLTDLEKGSDMLDSLPPKILIRKNGDFLLITSSLFTFHLPFFVRIFWEVRSNSE